MIGASEAEMLKLIFDLSSTFEQAMFDNMSFLKSPGFSMNRTQISTLAYLKYLGPSRMGTLSKLVTKEKGSFTAVANKLIKEKYIAKTLSKSDKRVSLLTLTTKGTDTINKIQNSHLKFLSKQFNKLDQHEKALYNASLQTMITLHHKMLT